MDDGGLPGQKGRKQRLEASPEGGEARRSVCIWGAVAGSNLSVSLWSSVCSGWWGELGWRWNASGRGKTGPRRHWGRAGDHPSHAHVTGDRQWDSVEGGGGHKNWNGGWMTERWNADGGGRRLLLGSKSSKPSNPASLLAVGRLGFVRDAPLSPGVAARRRRCPQQLQVGEPPTAAASQAASGVPAVDGLAPPGLQRLGAWVKGGWSGWCSAVEYWEVVLRRPDDGG